MVFYTIIITGDRENLDRLYDDIKKTYGLLNAIPSHEHIKSELIFKSLISLEMEYQQDRLTLKCLTDTLDMECIKYIKKYYKLKIHITLEV